MRALAPVSVTVLLLITLAGSGCEKPSLARSTPVAAPAAATVRPFAEAPPVMPGEHAPAPSNVLVATRVDLGDVYPGAFVIGRPASAEHPEGTIFAVAGRYGKVACLVEIDLASRAEIARVDAPDGGNLYREGDTIYLAQGGNHEVVLSSYDLGLRLRHRVSLRTHLVDDDDIFGFVVAHGHAVIVDPEFHVEMFDANGKRIAAHQCEGEGHRPGHARPIVIGDRIVVPSDGPIALTNDSGAFPACAFDASGKGDLVKARLPETSSIAVRDGRLVMRTLVDDGVHELRSLSTDFEVGAVLGREPSDERLGCDGVTGMAWWQTETFGRVKVVRTVNCCGGREPTGIFVCEPSN